MFLYIIEADWPQDARRGTWTILLYGLFSRTLTSQRGSTRTVPLHAMMSRIREVYATAHHSRLSFRRAGPLSWLSLFQ